MTDIEQQEFAVVKAALSLASCYGGAGFTDKRAVKAG